MRAKEELGSGRKKLVTINVAAIHGEPGTGYENGDLGEFECANCEYFDEKQSACGQKDMMKNSKQPRLKDGRVKVDPEGCCEYVERVGRKEAEEDEE
jgi:hypothetical protein